jgi:pyruvate/2-oxoglutarate dehydrogenase complex dihydrolipoamide acyltransferase (E2) component
MTAVLWITSRKSCSGALDRSYTCNAMNRLRAHRLTRKSVAIDVLGLVVAVGAVVFVAGTGRAHAEQVADPPMSAAVFEDVPAPTSAPPPSAAASRPPAAATPPPSAPATTIATVTLQPPASPETDPEADAANGVVADPARDIGGSIRFDDLPHQIGARVRVLTRGQSLHRGVVRSADAKQVTLAVSQRGGSATYVLPREQIERIDPN